MPGKKKSLKPATDVQTKVSETPKKRAAKSSNAKGQVSKAVAPKAKKEAKAKPAAKAVDASKKQQKAKAGQKIKKNAKHAAGSGVAQILSSEVVYQGPLFRVLHDKLIEPDSRANERDVIRHNGSVVILAIDNSKSKKDPWIVVERQYRHAANQYLWELPAGKLDPGEDALTGAQRELSEETGYKARKWKPMVEYYASPGFLGESMKVFLAEGLVAGDAHPEEDEHIEFRLVKLSEILKMIDKGAILDGKTLTSVLLYSRRLGGKHKK